MSDDNKSPRDQLKELIQTGVNAANSGLRLAQSAFHNFKEPLSSTLQTVENSGTFAVETSKSLYAKRKQYATEIMLGGAVTTGGYLWLRRGRISGIVGAAFGTGIAYSVVYDEFPIDFENLPNAIFGKKDDK